MDSLLTKVLQAVHRERPCLTVRRVYDAEHSGERFEVRMSANARHLEALGACGVTERDRILALLKEAGYAVQEVVPGKQWSCHAPGPVRFVPS